MIFPAPVGSRYQIEVYGYTDSQYQVSFGLGLAGAEGVEPFAVAEKMLRSEPAIAPSNEPPGHSAVPPAPMRPIFRSRCAIMRTGRKLASTCL